jgi:hypothetical protein
MKLLNNPVFRDAIKKVAIEAASKSIEEGFSDEQIIMAIK